MNKRKHISRGKTKKPELSESSEKLKQKPILRIGVKFMVLLFILVIGLLYSDWKGYFAPNESNNHTKRKWDAYYDFIKRNEVDILLVGNSHLYTGINPKNLSTALGVNAFILASPGTTLADNYFVIKEAIKHNTPEIVVLETYGINKFFQYQLSEGAQSDQFKSFSARKDLMTKLVSTPFLFASKNFLFAWSNTLRNHDFIFTDTEQLKKNRELMKQPVKSSNDKLYLGRFVTYTTGIEDSLLIKYNSEGSPVNGNSYSYNEYTTTYVEKIVNLCKENEIELMFLTIPMYHQHIKDYSSWRNKLAEILDEYPNQWLDMQDPYSYEDLTPICFQNTYTSNQHMTYQGSLVATYTLADFIRKELDPDLDLPDRKKEQNWHRVFYGEEGYFENCSPSPEDSKNKILSKDQQISNAVLDEVILLPKDENSSTLLAKINREKFENNFQGQCQLQLMIEFTEDDQKKMASVVLPYDKLHEVPDHAIFMQRIKPLTINKVINGIIRCR